MNGIKKGIWPTMITPYDREGRVDLNAAKRAVKHNEVDAPSRGQPQEAKRPAEIDDSHLWC